MANETAELAEFLRWAIGGLAAATSGAFMTLWGRVSSAQAALDRHKLGHQAALDSAILDAEKRFALKTDLQQIAAHVDKRFDQLSEQIRQLVGRRDDDRPR